MAKSFQTMQTMFTILSQNTAASNTTLAGILLNDVHRYLLLKYFNNEQSFTMTTIGPQVLTITTSSLASGSTNAFLSSAWTYISCQQLVVFSDGEQRTVFFTQGSTAITWQSATTAVQTSSSISCVGVQAYLLPANISKLKTPSITIGQLVYIPYPVNSVQEWVKLNALPYTAAYPAYFFMFNNQLNFWPIPSSTGQIITLYAQINVPDLSYQDYVSTSGASHGTVSAAVGSNIITGSGTTFNTVGTFPIGVDLTFNNIQISLTPPGGDGLNYQVQSVQSDTSLTLKTPIVYAPNTSSVYFSIGQYPLLDANFHDAIVYGALRTYFSSISKDTDKATYFGGLYQEKIGQMDGYLSTKSVIVDLGTSPPALNPNLFLMSPSSSV